jgi:hypothetical protein
MAVLDDALSHLQRTVAAVERQLEERTAERDEALAQQTATSEILRAIAGSPTDIEPVFETIVGSAARVCEAEFSGVARFEDGVLHLVAVHSMSPEETAAFHSLFPRAPMRNFEPHDTRLFHLLGESEEDRAGRACSPSSSFTRPATATRARFL